MQLWTRMAQQQQQQQQQPTSAQQQQQNASLSPSPSLTGLAAGLRPHYFSTATDMRSGRSPSLTSLLSGKHHPTASSIYPTPPSSPKLGSTSTSTSSTSLPTPQQAALASMASQTLVQRLGGAFWQAFSGSSSSHPISGVCGTGTTSREPAWDADKIRRVLEGTAVVRVVDVEPPTAKNGKEVAKETKEVKEMMQQSQSQQQGCAKICASARETGLCVLEESMRALTLGKK